jgi:hypothetical protein
MHTTYCSCTLRASRITQDSHISGRYYNSRIPMRSNTRECNHVRLNPDISMYKSKFATNARARKDGQRRRRSCRGDCRDSRTSCPRRNAHRCARRRVSTATVTKRWHTGCHTPLADRPHGPPLSWRECESDGMKEAQPALRSQQHLGGTDDPRAAAVRCCRACFSCASPASSSSPPLNLCSYLTPCVHDTPHAEQ